MSVFFKRLTEDLGLSEQEFLDEYGLESVMPGICVKCNTVSECCEPDLRDGWCQNCEGQGVKSGLVLLGYL